MIWQTHRTVCAGLRSDHSGDGSVSALVRREAVGVDIDPQAVGETARMNIWSRTWLAASYAASDAEN